MASCHCRSSPGIRAATRFGGLKKRLPRSVEFVAVTPGTAVRLLTARFGTFVHWIGRINSDVSIPAARGQSKNRGAADIICASTVLERKYAAVIRLAFV